jgi:hypothetical protein
MLGGVGVDRKPVRRHVAGILVLARYDFSVDLPATGARAEIGMGRTFKVRDRRLAIGAMAALRHRKL